MSAECRTCGADIVYPVGTWPVGMCEVCDLRAQVETLREAIDDAITVLSADTNSARELGHAVRVARARLIRAFAEGEPDA